MFVIVVVYLRYFEYYRMTGSLVTFSPCSNVVTSGFREGSLGALKCFIYFRANGLGLFQEGQETGQMKCTVAQDQWEGPGR